MCVMTDDTETPQYAWDKQKNAWLRSERGFGFEDVVLALEEDGPLDDISHPNPKHSHQRILYVAIQGYAIAVPYVNAGTTKFFKTAYASRRARKQYLSPQQSDRPNV